MEAEELKLEPKTPSSKECLVERSWQNNLQAQENDLLLFTIAWSQLETEGKVASSELEGRGREQVKVKL